MKRLTLTIILALLLSSARAQNISNPGFDSVYIGGIDRIYSWITSDAWSFSVNDTVQPLIPNSLYSFPGHSVNWMLYTTQLEYANPYEGQFAMKLLCNNQRVKENGRLYAGFIANGTHFYTDNLGYIDIKRGGTPFTGRPQRLRGHFKFNNDSPSMNNYGKAIVLLKKFNTQSSTIDTIAYAESTVQFFPTSNWTAFELPLTYRSQLNPDSVVVYFQSSGSDLSSTLWLDSLGFIYPAPSSIQQLASTEQSENFYDQINQVIRIKNLQSNASMCVYDANGKLILKSKNAEEIPMRSYPNGVYFLHLFKTDGTKQIVKFSK